MEEHVRIDDLVDRLPDELHIAAVRGVVQTVQHRLVAGWLGC
ncbi:hypothetical protein ACFQGX_16300 [Nonomuraea dietziae]